MRERTWLHYDIADVERVLDEMSVVQAKQQRETFRPVSSHT